MIVNTRYVVFAAAVFASLYSPASYSRVVAAPTPVNVNMADGAGDTPLMLATTDSDMVRFTALIDAGADVNARNKAGDTPLLLAPNANYVKALIKAGANVNEAGANGDTPLILATTDSDMASFNALIAAGADINAKNKVGDTPLLLAPNAYFVKALIDAGTGTKSANNKTGKSN